MLEIRRFVRDSPCEERDTRGQDISQRINTITDEAKDPLMNPTLILIAESTRFPKIPITEVLLMM